MIHHTINDKSDHWAIGFSSNHKDLLLQVQEDGNQSRILLSMEQAVELSNKLADAILNIAQKTKGI